MSRAVLRDVADERARQDAKWGPQQHEPTMWIAILGEEFGEAAQAALRLHWDGAAAIDVAQYRKELIQIAAVAVAAVENIDGGILVQVTQPGEMRTVEYSRKCLGESFPLAMRGLCAEARCKACRVHLEFNGCHLYALPETTPEELGAQYDAYWLEIDSKKSRESE